MTVPGSETTKIFLVTLAACLGGVLVTGPVVVGPPGDVRVGPVADGCILGSVTGLPVTNSVVVSLGLPLVLLSVPLEPFAWVDGGFGSPVLSPPVPDVGSQAPVVDDLLAFEEEPHLARVVFPAGIQVGGDHPAAVKRSVSCCYRCVGVARCRIMPKNDVPVSE